MLTGNAVNVILPAWPVVDTLYTCCGFGYKA